MGPVLEPSGLLTLNVSLRGGCETHRSAFNPMEAP